MYTDSFIQKKSLGQNFLTSDYVPKLMCEAGLLVPGDIVLEIGPGTGALTSELLGQGAIVHAIETDDRATAALVERFAHFIKTGQLTIHPADIRDFDLSTIIGGFPAYKVIANIPYYLSGFLLRKVLELDQPPQTLVFLMQKEVVNRIARDSKQSILSLSVSVFGTPKYIKTISRGHFNPPPKVDSAILAIYAISHQNLPTPSDREHFFTLLHHGLGQKRKQLFGILTKIYPKEQVTAAFLELNLKLTVRGEDVSLTNWLALNQKLQTAN